MEKKLLIKNTIEYTFDKVTCFERPIANQLNYINGYYGDCFIILSKMYEFYFLQENKIHREEIIKLSEEILNFKIINL